MISCYCDEYIKYMSGDEREVPESKGACTMNREAMDQCFELVSRTRRLTILLNNLGHNVCGEVSVSQEDENDAYIDSGHSWGCDW